MHSHSATAAIIDRARHPSMRQGSPKYVRPELFFFRIGASHDGVEPGVGRPPGAVGAEPKDVVNHVVADIRWISLGSGRRSIGGGSLLPLDRWQGLAQ
jgi:hypothetical protein